VRALAHVCSGDLRSARQDLESCLTDPYAAIWLAVIFDDLRKLASVDTKDEWIRQLVALIQRRATSELILEAADSGTEDSKAGRLCEAHAFLGARYEFNLRLVCLAQLSRGYRAFQLASPFSVETKSTGGALVWPRSDQ
jgi:hypothetical protein